MKLSSAIAWFTAGGLGGAVGAALLLDGDGEVAAGRGPASFVATVTDLALGRAGDTRASTVAGRLDAYREVQQESDPEVLARSLERAAGRAWSLARDVEIDATLGRLAELAPDYAVALAESLGLDAVFVAQSYLVWAEADPDAALAGLAHIQGTVLRRDIALALTDVIGNDARSVDRIGAALAPADRDALRIAWLAERASSDPFGAFREAMNLGDSGLARRALDEVAVSWAAEDPAAALAQADLLPPDLAQVFRSSVFAEWARLDAEGYLSYLESQSALPTEAMSGLQYLIAANPEAVERVAGGMSGATGMSVAMSQSVRMAAMSASAMRDPETAKAEAQALQPGQQRDQMIEAVAVALARTDPRDALEWLRSLSPPATSSMTSVMLMIAQTDVVAALDLLDDPLIGGNSQLTLVLATSFGVSDPEQAPLIAERLATRTDAESQAALRRLVGNWMQRDPETALDWVLERGAEIDPNVLTGAAQTLAARDPIAAADYADRIPPAQRSAWIVQVATGYGRRDPQGAMAWISQYQGLEFYDTALRQLISSAAQTDALSASQMLSQSSPTVQFGAAQQVATALTQQNPRAAVSWAQTLSDPRARSSAQTAVAAAWYGSNPVDAKRYLLAQPASAERDQTITLMFQRAVAAGTFDRELLNGVGNESARRQMLTSGITSIARNNLAQARTLLASEVTDPALRATIAAQIDALPAR